ncbi:hypothetical protein D3C78_1836420 [compost metagenome]
MLGSRNTEPITGVFVTRITNHFAIDGNVVPVAAIMNKIVSSEKINMIGFLCDLVIIA